MKNLHGLSRITCSLVVLFSVVSGASGLQPLGEAPHNGMVVGSWSSGVKDVFGTAYEAYDSNNSYSASSSTEPLSKVWFTGSHGVLTEVFWSTVDRAHVKDSEFLVTDGKSFI